MRRDPRAGSGAAAQRRRAGMSATSTSPSYEGSVKLQQMVRPHSTWSVAPSELYARAAAALEDGIVAFDALEGLMVTLYKVRQHAAGTLARARMTTPGGAGSGDAKF